MISKRLGDTAVMLEHRKRGAARAKARVSAKLHVNVLKQKVEEVKAMARMSQVLANLEPGGCLGPAG